MSENLFFDSQIAALEKVGTVLHDEGVLLKMCCMVVLYSLDMRPTDQKEAVLRIYDDYMSLYGKRIRWTTNPSTGSWKKLKSGPADYLQPHDWIPDSQNGYRMVFHGGEKKTDATDLTFYAAAKREDQVLSKDLSMIHCRFPMGDIFEGKVILPEIAQRWCSWLRPLHGHGGLGLGRSFGYENQALSWSTETDMLLRMPGLQLWGVTEGMGFPQRQEGLYNGPRCADWLLSLSDTFLDKLGGLDGIKKNMADGLLLYPYEGGAVLQAGPLPNTGSTEYDICLNYYEQLGRLIEPVRAKKLSAELTIGTTDEDIKSDKERSKKWHERFSPHAFDSSPRQ